MLESLNSLLREGTDLSRDQMRTAIEAMMSGDCDERQMRDFLLSLREKGETADEITGAAEALRARMTAIPHRHARLLDTCGTGGSGLGLFNVSTAAAIVLAAVGVPVAKHGNRKVTSRSGSADVLAALGVNIEATPEQISRCLNEVGLAFCFAPLLHQAMKHVMPIRRALGVPTIFNWLGPLANPAQATHQLLGVSQPRLRPLLAGALQQLGIHRAVVVRGEDGLDEVTLAAETGATWVSAAGLVDAVWRPADFGLTTRDLNELRVDDATASATLVRAVLDGEPGPAREMVLANAAAGLAVFSEVGSLLSHLSQAAAAIDSGAAREKLAQLVEISHRPFAA